MRDSSAKGGLAACAGMTRLRLEAACRSAARVGAYMAWTARDSGSR